MRQETTPFVWWQYLGFMQQPVDFFIIRWILSALAMFEQLVVDWKCWSQWANNSKREYCRYVNAMARTSHNLDASEMLISRQRCPLHFKMYGKSPIFIPTWWYNQLLWNLQQQHAPVSLFRHCLFWLCATAFWFLLFCLKSTWNQEEVPDRPGPSQPLLDKNKS